MAKKGFSPVEISRNNSNVDCNVEERKSIGIK